MRPGPPCSRHSTTGVTDLDHRVVDVGDGLQLHAACRGQGPHLVLLHGFTGSAESWDPVRPALERRRTVTAVDLPGHGRSSAPAHASRYRLTRFADDLARLLDALDIDRAAVVGYSFGGRAALRFVLRHPQRVSALVLESTSPGIDDPAERAARARSDAELADAIERGGVTAFVDRWEQLPLWESQKFLAGATRARLRAQRLDNDWVGLAHSLLGAGAAAEPAVTPQLPSVAVPALLVAGALDRKYGALAGAMAAAMPNARAALVPDAGHAVHLEQPDAFTSLVTGFLDSFDP